MQYSPKIIGLKQFREDIQKIAESVAIGNEYVVVKRSQPMFKIVGPDVVSQKSSSRGQVEAWKKLAGILKGKKIEDPVKWQKKIRKEWDRDFSPRTK